MKKILTVILFALFTIVTVAQSNYQEVVYLKNGSIIRGVIIEQIPNKSIKIETADKSVFVYQMDEIEKLTKEQTKSGNKAAGSLSSTGSGNKESARVSFGIKGGLNLSKIHAKDDDDNYSEDYKLNPGFHIGLTAEVPISEAIAFETGLLLSTKGFKVSESETMDGNTIKIDGSLNLLCCNPNFISIIFKKHFYCFIK